MPMVLGLGNTVIMPKAHHNSSVLPSDSCQSAGHGTERIWEEKLINHKFLCKTNHELLPLSQTCNCKLLRQYPSVAGRRKVPFG